jgi:hypothetical protein
MNCKIAVREEKVVQAERPMGIYLLGQALCSGLRPFFSFFTRFNESSPESVDTKIPGRRSMTTFGEIAVARRVLGECLEIWEKTTPWIFESRGLGLIS